MARAKETLPVASFSMSGNSPKYEEKIFPFYVAFEIYIYIFKLYNVKILHLCIYILYI